MNEVSAAVESVAAASCDVEEIDIFARLDPLLASLQKEYHDARGVRIQVEKDYGRHDAMMDIALLAEDSAWCAMQTRYMELRAQRALMKKAQMLMNEALREAQRRKQADKRRAVMERYFYFERMRVLSGEDARGAHILLTVLLLHMMEKTRVVRYAPSFNRMAA